MRTDVSYLLLRRQQGSSRNMEEEKMGISIRV